jgi:hypothetical protein
MKKRITWEKYENFVNRNLSISKMLMSGKIFDLNDGLNNDQEDDYDEQENDYFDDDDDIDDGKIIYMQFPMTPELLQSIKISGNFNCWFGHTNFDITKSVAKKLDEIEGVELLKVITRYRFLIGVGKAFSFANVRLNLENNLEVGK